MATPNTSSPANQVTWTCWSWAPGGYGPLRAVLLGSVSSALVRSARSPLVVVPRAANGEPSQGTTSPRRMA
jgi:hypothetical protein